MIDILPSIERHQELSGKSEYTSMFLSMNKVPRLTKVMRYIRNHPLRGNLLDIGCGDGSFGLLMKKEGYDVYGLEWDKELSAAAQRRGLKAKRGSFLTRFPFAHNFFDGVFAGEVIEHTFDDDYFLSECFRVLKEGGFFIVTAPNLLSFGNRIRMVVGLLPTAYQPYHYRIYNFRLLTEKIKRAGFRILHVTSSHVLISRYLNTWYAKLFGPIGETLGTFFPKMGEQFIIYATK